jgi:hypothetical protein
MSSLEDTDDEKDSPDSQEEGRAKRFGGQSSLYGSDGPHASVIGALAPRLHERSLWCPMPQALARMDVA